MVREVWIPFGSVMLVPEQGEALRDAAGWIELSGRSLQGFLGLVCFPFLKQNYL